MPTQNELNEAQVELDIANDNYAQLANKYNKYRELFQAYSLADDATKLKAESAMKNALNDYYKIQEQMRTAEDRINIAQNTVNTYKQAAARATIKPKTINPNPTPGSTIIPNTIPETVGQYNETNIPEPTPSSSKGENPYLELYSIYATKIAEGEDLGTFYDRLILTPGQVYMGMLDAGLTEQQVVDFLKGWNARINNNKNKEFDSKSLRQLTDEALKAEGSSLEDLFTPITLEGQRKTINVSPTPQQGFGNGVYSNPITNLQTNTNTGINTNTGGNIGSGRTISQKEAYLNWDNPEIREAYKRQQNNRNGNYYTRIK